MENSQSIFEKKAQEECIDEQKLCYLASKVAIWDHFCIPRDYYLALDTNEKSKMLNEYYKKLIPLYFKYGKDGSFFLSESWNFFCQRSGFWPFSGYLLKFYWCVLGDQYQQKKVDSEISAATKDQQWQSPCSKADSEIYASTKDQ